MAGESAKVVRGPMGGNRGNRGVRGMKSTVENPGAVFKRLIGYVFQYYAPHCIIVVIAIIINVLASVRGTWFMQTLIDGYIVPLMKADNPDFSGLAGAIGQVGVFYLFGAAAAYLQAKIMIYISQGTLKRLRDTLFTHMESLPIKYFDSHAHGDIMSIYTNDVDTLRQMISQSMPQIFSSAITIVSVFISMIMLSIPLTVVTLLMVGLVLFTTGKLAGQSGKYFTAQQ